MTLAACEERHEAVCGDRFAWAGTAVDGNGVEDERTRAVQLAQCGTASGVALDEAATTASNGHGGRILLASARARALQLIDEAASRCATAKRGTTTPRRLAPVGPRILPSACSGRRSSRAPTRPQRLMNWKDRRGRRARADGPPASGGDQHVDAARLAASSASMPFDAGCEPWPLVPPVASAPRGDADADTPVAESASRSAALRGRAPAREQRRADCRRRRRSRRRPTCGRGGRRRESGVDGESSSHAARRCSRVGGGGRAVAPARLCQIRSIVVWIVALGGGGGVRRLRPAGTLPGGNACAAEHGRLDMRTRGRSSCMSARRARPAFARAVVGDEDEATRGNGLRARSSLMATPPRRCARGGAGRLNGCGGRHGIARRCGGPVPSSPPIQFVARRSSWRRLRCAVLVALHSTPSSAARRSGARSAHRVARRTLRPPRVQIHDGHWRAPRFVRMRRLDLAKAPPRRSTRSGCATSTPIWPDAARPRAAPFRRANQERRGRAAAVSSETPAEQRASVGRRSAVPVRRVGRDGAELVRGARDAHAARRPSFSARRRRRAGGDRCCAHALLPRGAESALAKAAKHEELSSRGGVMKLARASSREDEVHERLRATLLPRSVRAEDCEVLLAEALPASSPRTLPASCCHLGDETSSCRQGRACGARLHLDHHATPSASSCDVAASAYAGARRREASSAEVWPLDARGRHRRRPSRGRLRRGVQRRVCRARQQAAQVHCRRLRSRSRRWSREARRRGHG